MTPEEQYHQYLELHRDFSETYSSLYRYILEFYPQPQKFIAEASPEIDHYVKNFSASEQDERVMNSFESLFYFAKHFREFTITANEVFDEYKLLHDASGAYIKRVFRLKEKDKIHNECDSEYAQLIPTLTKLITGFKQVKYKTDAAAQNLQRLQSEWGVVKKKMSSKSQ